LPLDVRKGFAFPAVLRFDRARLRFDHCEAQPHQMSLESGRKGEAFPHIRAAKPPSFA